MSVSTETVAVALGAKPPVAVALEVACIRYGITSMLEKAHFLAQVAHESDGFKTASEYASGKAYEGRKDLGNTQPGDGVRFKGRGLIQITGRANYGAYSRWKYGDERLLQTPALLAELPDAVDAAAWYWTVARPKLPSLARADNLEAVTRQINGGLNGLEDRRAKLIKAKALFAAQLSDGA
jgi:putative chitinase